MPRVEIVPDDFDFDGDEGTPTVDLCKRCAGCRQEGDELNRAELRRFGVGPVRSEFGEMAVEHPDYTDGLGDYDCEWCLRKLTDADN